MENFTDIKDLNYKVLYTLDDKSLENVCRVNSKIKALCDNDLFWKNRIIQRYGEKLLDIKPEDMTFKQFYQSKVFQKVIKLCFTISRIPKKSKLVLDLLYSPKDGIIDTVFTRVDLDIYMYLYLKLVYNISPVKDERLAAIVDKYKNKILRGEENFFGNEALPDLSFDTLEFTDKDSREFKEIISVDVENRRPEILRRFSTKASSKEFMEALGKTAPEAFKIILHIHEGLYKGLIPLDITWEEVCAHPYMLSLYFP